MKTIQNFFDKTIDFMGRVISWLLLLLVLNVLFDVVMRYFFHNSSVGMQEMEWHLFAVIILYGVGFALKTDSHVRVDFLYDNFAPSTKNYINIFGTIFFLIPVAVLIITGSTEFIKDAYITSEISEDPGGLTHRWIIKAMIPAGFIFLIFSAISYILKNIIELREVKK
ncbi:MAG: C4-dicarboxylate ABC transporter permease [Gammaproteobacteria bacterium]|nr:MAG: C4-dicarboxylate ABC transporter permease [Gammaproteobacteria bacterium]